jgi:hypothetical protein
MVDTVFEESHLIVLWIDLVKSDEAADDVSGLEGGATISLIAKFLVNSRT